MLRCVAHQGVMEELTGSRKRCDKQLISEVDSIVVELTERAEAAERRRRVRAPVCRGDVYQCPSGWCVARWAASSMSAIARATPKMVSSIWRAVACRVWPPLDVQATARLRLDVGVILDDGGGRSRRARKEVNYTFDAYDEMIGEAVKYAARCQTPPIPACLFYISVE